MAELITTGVWTVDGTKQVAFIDAWEAFAAWASSIPGAGILSLGRDVDDPQRFVSFALWRTNEAVRAWKASPEFRPRMAEVLQHVDEFHPAELDVVATGADGASTVGVRSATPANSSTIK